MQPGTCHTTSRGLSHMHTLTLLGMRLASQQSAAGLPGASLLVHQIHCLCSTNTVCAANTSRCRPQTHYHMYVCNTRSSCRYARSGKKGRTELAYKLSPRGCAGRVHPQWIPQLQLHMAATGCQSVLLASRCAGQICGDVSVASRSMLPPLVISSRERLSCRVAGLAPSVDTAATGSARTPQSTYLCNWELSTGCHVCFTGVLLKACVCTVCGGTIPT